MPLTQKFVSVLALALLLLTGAMFINQTITAQKKKPAQAAVAAAGAKCAAMSDADIVKTIADRVRKDDRFADQLDHISVTSKDHKVTLAGWVKNKTLFDAIAEYAKQTGCAVTNKLGRSAFRVGCGTGMKDCYGSCIPIGDACESIKSSGR